MTQGVALTDELYGYYTFLESMSFISAVIFATSSFAAAVLSTFNQDISNKLVYEMYYLIPQAFLGLIWHTIGGKFIYWISKCAVYQKRKDISKYETILYHVIYNFGWAFLVNEIISVIWILGKFTNWHYSVLMLAGAFSGFSMLILIGMVI
jgi:hypothetical protein